MQDADWDAKAANLLKSELKRHGIKYADLVKKLAEIGVTEKEVNIRNKLSRGTFTATYLLQCLEAIGCKTLRLD
jgi:3-mercaptopyruvate sulfurtransferase SseA